MTVVIKKKPDQSVVKRVVCGNCGATLEYVPKDVHRRDDTNYGGPDGEEWISCSECKERVILKG
jgi:hypothetical protein